MNIQIFMSKKNFDCQKAERWFKERRIPFQSVDLIKKGLNMIDTESKKYAESAVRFMSDKNMIRAQLLENPQLLRGPIVRNGRQATVGYHPEVWETWE